MQWNRSIKEVDGPTIASCEALVVNFQRIPEEYAEILSHSSSSLRSFVFLPGRSDSVRVEGA